MNERKNYPALQNYTYLNTASCGLFSEKSLKTVQQTIQQYTEKGSVVRDSWYDELSGIRNNAARLVGASASEIALITNFTSGIYQAAHLLKEHSRVLVVEDDYPTLLLPWQLLGYQVHSIAAEQNGSIRLDKIESSIREHQIQIMAITHVQYSSGFRISLEELGQLCRQYNVLLVVDATQSLGMAPIDLKKTPVDILIGSGYKWLTAGLGNGIMYVNEKLHKVFHPQLLGIGTVGNHFSLEEISGIPFTPQTLEAGHYNYFSLLALGQALEAMLERGVDNVFNHNMELRKQFINKLPSHVTLVSDYKDENASSIVVVQAPDTAEELLKKKNIITSTRPRGLRISPHFYNNAEDIQQLCQALTEL